MTTGTAVRNTLVGAVFLGSLVVLGVFTYAVQGLPFLHDSQEVLVRFANVDNVQVGDAVLVQGYRIGLVDDIAYEPQRSETPVAVKCSLRERIDLTTGTTFSIRDSGPLGGRYIEITPGEGDPTDDTYDLYVGHTPGGLFKQLEDLIESNQASVTEILATIRDIVNDVKEGKGLLGSAIGDQGLRDAVSRGVEEFRETFRAINEGKGPLGALVTDTALRDRFTKMFYELSDATDALTEEKGIIGLLLNNEKTKEDAARSIEDFRELMSSVRQGEGILPRLLTDESLADGLSGILTNLNDVAEKANSGEGTISQALNNPKAWDELVRILVLSRETIEDLREAAPISTFINAAFAGF